MILIILFFWWTSPRPVIEQRAVVTGGIVQGMANNGQHGSVWIDAPRECVTIHWEGRTQDGATLRSMRAWRNGCYKAYLPL